MREIKKNLLAITGILLVAWRCFGGSITPEAAEFIRQFPGLPKKSLLLENDCKYVRGCVTSKGIWLGRFPSMPFSRVVHLTPGGWERVNWLGESLPGFRLNMLAQAWQWIMFTDPNLLTAIGDVSCFSNGDELVLQICDIPLEHSPWAPFSKLPRSGKLEFRFNRKEMKLTRQTIWETLGKEDILHSTWRAVAWQEWEGKKLPSSMRINFRDGGYDFTIQYSLTSPDTYFSEISGYANDVDLLKLSDVDIAKMSADLGKPLPERQAVSLRYNLALAYCFDGDYAPASNYFRLASELAPRAFAPRFRIAQLAEQKGNAAAWKAYSDLMSRFPDRAKQIWPFAKSFAVETLPIYDYLNLWNNMGLIRGSTRHVGGT